MLLAFSYKLYMLFKDKKYFKRTIIALFPLFTIEQWDFLKYFPIKWRYYNDFANLRLLS